MLHSRDNRTPGSRPYSDLVHN